MAPINIALTGGAKAPGGGKAPRGGGGEPRYWSQRLGKMITAKEALPKANPRVAAASRAMGAPRAHAAAPPAKAPAQPKSTPYVHYLGTTFGFPAAKGRGIEGLINAAEGAERGTVLAPYQQRGREINNTEQTVSNRVGAFNQQAQNAYTGIVGQQEGSAKTFENNAAETALKSEKGIETAGQNAITSSGGYLDPQLRAQIAASQAEIAGLGQAGVTRANELGNAQNAYMRQLQAAGVQRGQENQREIANIYGAERARNTAAETTALGRLEAKAKAERITIPKELRTLGLAEGKLAQAGELGQEKIGVGLQKNAVTARGQNLTREGRGETNAVGRERNKVTERGQNLTRASAREGHQVSREGHLLTRMSAAERNAITGGKSSAKRPMTPAQVTKVETEMHNAFAEFKRLNPEGITNSQIRAALRVGGYRGAAGKLNKTSKTSDLFGQAAEEIWYNRQLSPEMKATFHQLGIPEKAWSNELLGPPPISPGTAVRGGVEARKR